MLNKWKVHSQSDDNGYEQFQLFSSTSFQWLEVNNQTTCLQLQQSMLRNYNVLGSNKKNCT